MESKIKISMHKTFLYKDNLISKIEHRSFLKSAGAISTLTILKKPVIAFGSKNNSTIRMGFIGCGSRDTSVISIMSANTNIDIIPLVDFFDDAVSDKGI